MPTAIPHLATSASPVEARIPLTSATSRQRLARSRVLLVGVEPWGAVAAADLAAAGVGALHVLDDGRVTGDDLFAFRAFTGADRGKPRVEALSGCLSRLAPGCSVTSGALVAAPANPLALDDTRWDLVLACVPGDDLLVLQSVARFAHTAGLVSLSAHLDGFDAMLGPAVTPDESACWNCARLRGLATSRHPRADRALHASLLTERARPRAHTYLASMPALLGHALALAAVDLLVSPATAPFVGRIHVQNLVTLATSVHAVLRLPSCAVCGGARAALPGGTSPEGSGKRLDTARTPEELRRLLAGVVDPRTGIIKHLMVSTADPGLALDTPVTATALLSGSSSCGHDDHEPELGSGKGLVTVEAMIGAVGEAVERYSAAYIDRARLLRAPAVGMTSDHIAPERLCLYDESQYAQPGFPFSRLAGTQPIDWVLGRWLDTREPVYLPALPVYFNYHAPPEEHFCEVTSNGLAAGSTLEDASMRAALELIERDAYMISWLARRPGWRILLDDSVAPGVREVARQLGDRGVRLELHLLDVGLRVPAVMCVGFGDGERWPGATVAMAAHLSPRAAIAKAILEQAHGGTFTRRMMEEGKKVIPARPDDVRTLEDHALYYIPPSRAEAFAFLAGSEEVTAADLEEPGDVSLDALVRRVRAAGLRIAIADVTSPDLEATPFRVARAVGPDFQQIHFGHLHARLGNPRLLAMVPHGINPDPHPMH